MGLSLNLPEELSSLDFQKESFYLLYYIKEGSNFIYLSASESSCKNWYILLYNTRKYLK